MPEESKKASERLEEAYNDRFANDQWHFTQLAATMSAVDWLWLVRLAEWGYEKRRQEIRAETGGTDISGALSLAEWLRNISELADKLCTAPVVKPKKPRKGATRQ